MPNWTGKWKGGRTYTNKAGLTVWVLEKRVHGASYTMTLEAKNGDEALAELALFSRDPETYRRRFDAVPEPAHPAAGPLALDDELVKKFLEYLKRGKRTERYRKNVRNYLADWSVALMGKDLRHLTLQVLKDGLQSWESPESGEVIAKKHRITSIKSFFSWLREERALLTIPEDATLALKVPLSRPEKSLRDKGYEMKLVERFYTAITGWPSKKYGWKGTDRLTEVQSVRDVVCLHAKCGMHGTEIDRLARGEGEVRPVSGHGEIAGTVKFIHKSGQVHVQSLDLQALSAAQRLQARGSAPVDWWIRRVIKEAAKTLGCKPIHMGELRHSFVTWALERGVEIRPQEGGVPMERIAATIGHHSPLTTKKFYDGMKVPTMIKLPIKLHHPEDPLPLVANLRQAGS